MDRPRVNQAKERREVSAIKKAQAGQRKRLSDWLARSAEVLAEQEVKNVPLLELAVQTDSPT